MDVTFDYDYDSIALKSITIPEGVTSIGESAFYDCSLLESVVLPSTLVTINESAFNNCSVLTIYYEIEEQPEAWDYL